MTRSIYLAGASAELERVEAAAAACRELGWEVVSDWTADVRKLRDEGKTDADLPADERRGCALEDGAAIQSCDYFWLLVPRDPRASIGCWIEYGQALRVGTIATLLMSGDMRASIFTELADITFATDEGALAWLAEEVGR